MDRRVSILIVSVALAGGIIAFMLLRVWGDLLAAIEHWNPFYLIPAVAFATAGWWLRGARYRSILGSLGIRAGLVFSTACVLISQTANLVIPARLGDLVRVFILKHENLSGYSTGISSIIIERFFDILTVALLGLVALPFVLGVPTWVYYTIVVPLAICGVFVLVLLALGKVQSKNRILAIAISMIQEMRKASLSARAVLGLSGLSVIIWATDVATTLSVAAMFGARVSVAVVLLAVVIGNLFKAVPVTPGGIGTYEAAVAVILVLSGTGQATATLIAVSDHLVKNLITAVGGILSIRLLGTWVVDAIRDAFRGKGEART
ncbi:MAG TPA: lysylphosphatidylglycerol synthase transmembrane domain-containing protein [Methanomicrobiales archaeon]|nr:lysylphosphatidylglycerol synthase transmembrane domain-containing protein [Methanomicrobiales archaeon]